MSVLPVRLWRVCAGVTAALGLAAVFPAGGSAATVAQPGGATAVREYGGTIVFSQFDWTTRRWYLTVRRAGATAQRLKVASNHLAFDADIGTDSRGRAQLIYQRCKGSSYRPTGCNLFVYSLVNGTGERPVRNANDPSHNDVHATIWRGRIAWTREYGSGRNANPVVYTKTLTAPRSQPSRRLPGVPRTRCGDVDKVCGPTAYRDVQALELSGNNLAVTVFYLCKGCSGSGQSELRLNRLTDGSSRRIALLVVGESGPQIVGPSFFDGRLAWYKTCGFSTCNTARPWRYRLSTGSYQRGQQGPRRLAGFADSGSRLYQVLGCNGGIGSPPQRTSNCRIDETAAPTYSAAPAPIR